MDNGQSGETDEGPQGYELTHGQIEYAGGLINEDKPESNQAIHATGSQPSDDDLN